MSIAPLWESWSTLINYNFQTSWRILQDNVDAYLCMCGAYPGMCSGWLCITSRHAFFQGDVVYWLFIQFLSILLLLCSTVPIILLLVLHWLCINSMCICKSLCTYVVTSPESFLVHCRKLKVHAYVHSSIVLQVEVKVYWTKLVHLQCMISGIQWVAGHDSG